MKQKIKKYWYRIFALCLAFAAMNLVGTQNHKTVQAATKNYYTKKYYKTKISSWHSNTNISYGDVVYRAKYKERPVTTKTTKETTTYYKHTKTVSTSVTVKKSKKKYYYSKKITKIDDAKKYIPNAVYQKWKKSGYKIIQNPIEKSFQGKNDVAGLFSVRRKAIILREYQSDQSVFLHEIGHFVDYMNGNKSDQKDFIAIYNKEKNASGFDSYDKSSASEYFANAFKKYCKKDASFKKQCPKTYQYINNIIKKM